MEHVQCRNVPSRKQRFDLLFFKRFLKLLKLMFPSCWSVQLLICVFLLCLGLLEQVVIYNIGLVPSKYYLVFGEKDKDGFKHATIMAAILIVSEAFIKSSTNFVTSILYVTWRGTITTAVHKEYFTDILYYDINISGHTDNPDQRITQDIDKLCYSFSQIFSPLIISPFVIIYYIYQCIKTTGYLGPTGVISFFIVSTIINKLLMSPVVSYVFKRERREGDFRFKHMQIRVNSESAAFYRSGSIEQIKTDNYLKKLLAVQRKQITREYALNFAVNLFDYLGSILSYILLAIPIFNGVYDNVPSANMASVISQNSFVIIYLINKFTNLIDLAVQVTTMAGTAHRVGELLEDLGYLKSERNASYGFIDKWHRDDNMQEMMNLTDMHVITDRAGDDGVPGNNGGMVMSVKNVNYGPPKSRNLLCKNLTFHMELGVNVLVTGESGSGKSSLLRVLCGLWPTVTGSISQYTPLGPQGIFYLPQKPYFTNGSLRQQIIYPLNDLDADCSVSADDERIQKYIDIVGLNGILDRVFGLDVDVTWNWYDELSPGEMQRLSFVRLFYHQPKFAVLDEATSQVGLDAEEKLYKLCQELGITVLSVGHRLSLRKYHHMELNLDGKGGWKFQPIRDDVIFESTSS